jgi:hypothetical protein
VELRVRGRLRGRGRPRFVPRAAVGTVVARSRRQAMTRAGVAVWSAAPARAAVSARGRGDEDGCAGPAAGPARPRPSPVAHPADTHVIALRCDVERLNRLLRSGLTFYVESDGGRNPPRVGTGASSASDPAGAGRACRSRPRTDIVRARGVLVMVLEDGRCRKAACSIPISGSERSQRLSISRGLSECAMALGLGASVYRRRR